jgi:hypothetical protein
MESARSSRVPMYLVHREDLRWTETGSIDSTVPDFASAEMRSLPLTRGARLTPR